MPHDFHLAHNVNIAGEFVWGKASNFPFVVHALKEGAKVHRRLLGYALTYQTSL